MEVFRSCLAKRLDIYIAGYVVLARTQLTKIDGLMLKGRKQLGQAESELLFGARTIAELLETVARNGQRAYEDPYFDELWALAREIQGKANVVDGVVGES
jgi:hypothetical protein